MSTKVFLKNDNEIMLPITRGELILDSSGQQAFHSEQFLANENRHGLMSKDDKINIKNIIEKTEDLDINELNSAINSIKNEYLKSVKVDNNKLTITDQSNTETDFYNTLYIFESGTNGSFTVRVNEIESQTITVGTLTDEKVGQKNVTDNKEYRILLSNSDNDNDETAPSNKSEKLLFNPSTGTLTATSFKGKVNWNNIDCKPKTFKPKYHKHLTDEICISNNYKISENSESIYSDDALTEALGKLEYKANLGEDAWDWINSTISDTDDNNTDIDRLKEIFDILKGIKETDVITSIIGNYLPLKGGILSGDLTFGAGSNDRYLTFSSSTTSKDATHSYRFGYLGSGTGENNLFVLQGSKTTTNTWSNIFSITAESLKFKFEVPVNTGQINLVGNQSVAMGDNYINLYNSTTNAARIGTNRDNALGLYSQGIIYIRPKMSSTFDISSNGLVINDTTFTYNGHTVYHSGNLTSLKNPEVIKFTNINNETKSYDGSSELDLTSGINYAVSTNYSRNLLGRTTSDTDYTAIDENLIFAEWNTQNDNRWYLKAKKYETRVGYANNSDLLDGTHKSGLLTDVSGKNQCDGNNLSITVGGTSKTIKKLHSSYLDSFDVRASNYLPNDETVYPSKSCISWFSNNGTPDTNWYSGISVKGWTSINNYNVWQLVGYSGNATSTNPSYNLYFRHGYDTTWGSWKTILDSSNFESFISDKYLPLSGGTMTGSIITPANNSEGIWPATNNYGQIGSSSKKFYRMYASTFNGNLNGNVNGSYIELSANTPYIDFHYGNASDQDYTTRIIEYSSYLHIVGKPVRNSSFYTYASLSSSYSNSDAPTFSIDCNSVKDYTFLTIAITLYSNYSGTYGHDITVQLKNLYISASYILRLTVKLYNASKTYWNSSQATTVTICNDEGSSEKITYTIPITRQFSSNVMSIGSGCYWMIPTNSGLAVLATLS